MEAIDKAGLLPLFERLRAVFAAQREALIALDGQVGDSDLGITMNKAFTAAADAVAADTASGVGKTLMQVGMAIAKAAPSTMGTLTATGFMRGGKAVGEAPALGTAEWARFWQAYRDGVMERGKARPGDKTLVDVLVPVAAALETAAADGAPLPQALASAAQAARAGLEATRDLVAQHGKAAAFQERTRGLQDAGATVGVLIIEALRDHVAGTGPDADPKPDTDPVQEQT